MRINKIFTPIFMGVPKVIYRGRKGTGKVALQDIYNFAEINKKCFHLMDFVMYRFYFFKSNF